MGVKRFKRQRSLLEAFAAGKSNLQKAIVKNADTDFIRAIIDIVVNLLRGNISNIPTPLTKRLNKHKNSLRKIGEFSQRKGSIEKARRTILVQRGGIFPLIPLLSKVIPLAASVLGGLFNR